MDRKGEMFICASDDPILQNFSISPKSRVAYSYIGKIAYENLPPFVEETREDNSNRVRKYAQGVISGISICPPSGISSCISGEGAARAGSVEKLIPFGAAPLEMVAMTAFCSMSITETVFS